MAGQSAWAKVLQWGGAAVAVGAVSIGGYVAFGGGSEPTTTTLPPATTTAPPATTTTVSALASCLTFRDQVLPIMADIETARDAVFDVLADMQDDSISYEVGAGMLNILAGRMGDLGEELGALGSPPTEIAPAVLDLQVAVQLYESGLLDADRAIGADDADGLDAAFAVFFEGDDSRLGATISLTGVSVCR